MVQTRPSFWPLVLKSANIKRSKLSPRIEGVHCQIWGKRGKKTGWKVAKKKQQQKKNTREAEKRESWNIIWRWVLVLVRTQREKTIRKDSVFHCIPAHHDAWKQIQCNSPHSTLITKSNFIKINRVKLTQNKFNQPQSAEPKLWNLPNCLTCASRESWIISARLE